MHKKNKMNTINIQNTEDNIDYSNPIWTERKFANPNNIIRLGSTFSGVGAIEYALRRLNIKHEIVFAGDIDKNCKKTYFANYCISESAWHNDISQFDAKNFDGKIDLLFGGAPCQAFSTVGKKRGFEDTRGTLFREFARIINECKPKVFIFENVKGLIQHNKGETWHTIYSTFKEYCNYDIHYQILNSSNYGIPQNRERLFCIGFKEKNNFKFPKPIALKYKLYDFLEDYTDSLYYDPDSNAKISKHDSIDLDNEECFNGFSFPIREIEDKYYLSEKVAKYVLSSGTKNYKTSTRTDLDIARPLLQTMHKMHRAGIDNYVTFNKTKGVNGIRKLTPRECFRLMGFRDDFKIVVSDTAAYMEAGNSIVVDVLMALLKQLDITKYGIAQ